MSAQTNSTGLKTNWLLIGHGIVAAAAAIVHKTTPLVQELFGSAWGTIVVLTVGLLFILNLTWPKIWQSKKVGNTVIKYGARTRKRNAWLLGIAAFAYLLGLGYIGFGNEVKTEFFPRKEMAVIINNIQGDHDKLKITADIRSNVANQLVNYESEGLVKQVATEDTFHFASDDYKKIDDIFMSMRYVKGLFSFGWYREMDSSLAGHIYIKNLQFRDSSKAKVIFPNLDSIKVSVSRKCELFGDFIAALVYCANKDYERSNERLNEILKDSNLLDYRFKHYCHNYRSLNYTMLQDEANAKQEYLDATRALLGNECRLERDGAFYIFKTGDGFQVCTTDSMYKYKDYVVIMHKVPELQYTLIKCGTRHFSRLPFRSAAGVQQRIDSLLRQE